MKKIIILILFCSVNIFSQKLKKPSEGKTLIYFVRTNSLGFLINFKYFDGEKYLGKFNHGKYLAYECEPGKHLFWSKSENTDFLEADLEANKIYIIDSEPQMGAFKAGVKLIPFDNNLASYKNEKKYSKQKERILKSILEREEYTIYPEDLAEEEKDLKNLVARISEKYKKLKTDNEEIKQLPREMFFEQ